MNSLQTLYPYLTNEELSNRWGQAVRLLLKLRNISESDAVQIITTAADKKAGKLPLTEQEKEVINFFTSYKREKAPVYKMLKRAKCIHAALPTNSKLTIKF